MFILVSCHLVSFQSCCWMIKTDCIELQRKNWGNVLKPSRANLKKVIYIGQWYMVGIVCSNIMMMMQPWMLWWWSGTTQHGIGYNRFRFASHNPQWSWRRIWRKLFDCSQGSDLDSIFPWQDNQHNCQTLIWRHNACPHTFFNPSQLKSKLNAAFNSDFTLSQEQCNEETWRMNRRILLSRY